MTEQGIRPARIRNAMVRKFGLREDDLLNLSFVQNVANYHAKTKLGANDRFDEIKKKVLRLLFAAKKLRAKLSHSHGTSIPTASL